MPFCDSEDLFGKVERRITSGLGGFPEPEAFNHLSQLVEGLAGMHACGVAHHDFSLENVMVDGAVGCIIIDFGMCIRLPLRRVAGQPPVPLRPSNQWPCNCGKLLYKAPENMRPRASFDAFKADVWAVGVCFFLLLVGLPPWESTIGPVPTDQRYVVIARDRDVRRLLDLWRCWCRGYPARGLTSYFPPTAQHINLSDSCLDLLQGMLTEDPALRYDLEAVRNHPWVLAQGAIEEL